MTNLIPDKIALYAAALFGDISYTMYRKVINQKVVKYFAGTVYGGIVTTSKPEFDNQIDAYADAIEFVAACKRILLEREALK